MSGVSMVDDTGNDFGSAFDDDEGDYLDWEDEDDFVTVRAGGYPEGSVPWFAVAGRKSRDATLFAGHWAALGLHVEENLVAIDTGCVYGGALTAVRLDDLEVFSMPNAEA